MKLGDLLYSRRKELGLTLEEIGAIVGVGKSTVRKWETGYIENMKRDKIVLLAKALKVSPGFIMGWEDDKCNSCENQTQGITLSPEEQEILTAYSNASSKDKNMARMALDLPPLETNNVEFAKEFDIQEDMIRTLEAIASLPTPERTKQK